MGNFGRVGKHWRDHFAADKKKKEILVTNFLRFDFFGWTEMAGFAGTDFQSPHSQSERE